MLMLVTMATGYLKAYCISGTTQDVLHTLSSLNLEQSAREFHYPCFADEPFKMLTFGGLGPQF